MKLQVSLSAIPLSIAKKMMRKTPSKANHMYDAIFAKLGEGKNADKNRIYIPLDSVNIKAAKVVPPQAILDYLASIKFILSDYLLGTVLMPDGKRTVRLGKALSKKPELLRMFENDPQRKLVRNEKMWVVISRHPYDILGMSFDRGWSSCMNLDDGVNKHYLKGDLKQGTLVAYLIKDTDKNINAPVSRIAIRPYYEKKSIRKTKKNIYLIPSGVYGTDSEKFEKIVKKFCDMVNEHVPHGHYVLKSDLYDDGEGRDFFHIKANSIKDMSEEECIKLCYQSNLEPEIIEAMLKRKISSVTFRLVCSKLSSISQESLMEIIQDVTMKSSHRQIVQNQKNLSLDMLLLLAKSSDKITRQCLASQTNRIEVLKALTNDPDDDIRIAVADNYICSDDILFKLADDTAYDVLSAVLEAPNVSPNTINYILNNFEKREKLETARLTKVVLGRSDLPEDFMLPLIEKNLNKPFMFTSISTYRNLPSDLIRVLHDRTVSDPYRDVYGEEVMKNIARMKNTTLDVLEKLVDSEFEVASLLVRRQDISSEFVDKLLKSNPDNYAVISNILDRSEVTESQMQLIVTSQCEDAVVDSIRSGHMDAKAAKYFVENGSGALVKNAARRIAGEHPLTYAIAKYSKDPRAVLNLADYNDEPFPENVFVALLDNPACTASPQCMYALYYRANKDGLMDKVGERFASHLQEIDEYAKDDGRVDISEIEDMRINNGFI
jgi:hypothetical protein